MQMQEPAPRSSLHIAFDPHGEGLQGCVIILTKEILIYNLSVFRFSMAGKEIKKGLPCLGLQPAKGSPSKSGRHVHIGL